MQNIKHLITLTLAPLMKANGYRNRISFTRRESPSQEMLKRRKM